MAYPWLEYLRISHNSRKTLKSCARKFEFRKLYQHSKQDRSVPGDAGIALHAGYQEYLLNKDEDQAIMSMMLKYPIDLCNDPQDNRSLEACYATMIELMHSHAVQHYELVFIKCLDGETRPAIEVPFEIFLPGMFLDEENQRIPISYIGYIDLFIWNTVESAFEAIDIKSHRRTLRDLSALFQFDEQVLPYALMLEWLTNQQINSLKVTYLSTYLDIVNPQVVPYSFMKSRKDIMDWANGLMVDIRNLQQFYKLGWFPRDGVRNESCVAWNKSCPFFRDVCGSRNEKAIQYAFLQDGKPYVDNFEPWVTMELDLIG